MWDERYGVSEYIYGTEPNDFLKDNLHVIPKGRVLCLAEGEGRNAVYLASHGYSVTAVDSSRVGIGKAENLAGEHNVQIEFVHSDLNEYMLGENQWDGIISIFCPLPKALRERVHQNVVKALKPGGVFLLEAYTPAQIHYGTGGGSDTEQMQTSSSLGIELAGLHFNHLKECERKVIEGTYHTGMASVVQAMAVKQRLLFP